MLYHALLTEIRDNLSFKQAGALSTGNYEETDHWAGYNETSPCNQCTRQPNIVKCLMPFVSFLLLSVLTDTKSLSMAFNNAA